MLLREIPASELLRGRASSEREAWNGGGVQPVPNLALSGFTPLVFCED